MPRPAAVPASVPDGTWQVVVDLVAGLPDPALARTVTMTSEQVRRATTPTALDAAVTLLIASTEEQEHRRDFPSGDAGQVRLRSTGRVSAVLAEVLASRGTL